nr:hypothetical protein [Pandoravirus aubagnensis]
MEIGDCPARRRVCLASPCLSAYAPPTIVVVVVCVQWALYFSLFLRGHALSLCILLAPFPCERRRLAGLGRSRAKEWPSPTSIQSAPSRQEGAPVAHTTIRVRASFSLAIVPFLAPCFVPLSCGRIPLLFSFLLFLVWFDTLAQGGSLFSFSLGLNVCRPSICFSPSSHRPICFRCRRYNGDFFLGVPSARNKQKKRTTHADRTNRQ